MLLPRFSTRTILVITAICAVYSLLVGLAIRGSAWAGGLAIAATSLVFAALVYAALFALCYLFATLVGPVMREASSRLIFLVTRRRVWTWGLWVGLSGACAGMFAAPMTLFAGIGGTVTLPPPAVKPKTGLRVTVNATWVENYGYIPVNVTVSSAKPTTADQTITFRFKAGNWQMGGQPVMSVDQDIELPEGTTSVSETVLVPKLQHWHLIWWDVLVDGGFEEELSLEQSAGSWFNQGGGSVDNVPRILVVTEDGSQTGVSTTLIPSALYQRKAINVERPAGNITYGGVTTGVATVPFAVQRDVADLPDEWLAYSALDCLVCSTDQLSRIQEENPRAWQAIARWIRSGGNLWLCGLGNRWEMLDATLKHLDAVVEPDETGQVSWYLPFSSGTGVASAFQREAAAVGNASKPTPRDAFAWRPAGMGAVLISQKPFDRLTGREWSWLQDQAGLQLGWVSRHGAIPDVANPDFANLLIPGVGVAPVTEFRILITLFVVLIGPVNYWFLKRCNRLHLLILTVPVAALLVTVALFAYAVIGDGLGTRLRVRSYTSIDQRSGESASWARLSYYAGLAPSGGLELPDDTAIYPLNPGQIDTSNFGRRPQLASRVIQWADKQYLTEGWLASRTPTQYLTVTARPTDKNLQIAREDDGNLRVTNRLGAAIEFLVLRDKEGRLFTSGSVQPDQAIVLAPVEQETKVAGKLRALFEQHRPEPPEGYDEQYRGIASRRRRIASNTVYSTYVDPDYGSASGSRLEQRLASFQQPVGAASGRSLNLPNGTYMAVTGGGVEIATGLDGADEEASFHVVEGRW